MAYLKIVALCLFGAVALSSARPRFVAIPIEDVEFINFGDQPHAPIRIPYSGQGHRISRRALPDEIEAPSGRGQQDSTYAASNAYSGNDYVDYGAYTGGNGAFGWYSDHPVGGAYH